MFGRKKKALMKQLEERAQEIEKLRSQFNEKELELNILKDELNNTQQKLGNTESELAGTKRELSDFRSREESIVTAMTEATTAKDRILKDARANADRIETDAVKRRKDLIAEGQSACDKAKNEADQILQKAKQDAEKLRSDTEENAKRTARESARRAEETVDEAERTSAAMIDEARRTAKNMIDDAEEHIMKRTTQLDELNLILREKAKLAHQQAELYAEILNSVTECSDLSELSAGCDQRCESCGEKCEDYIPADTNPAASAAENAGSIFTGQPIESALHEEPQDGLDAATLMKNIYSIEGRELPDESEQDDGAAYDIGEGTPLTPDEGERFEMPVDPELGEILNDILKK